MSLQTLIQTIAAGDDKVTALFTRSGDSESEGCLDPDNGDSEFPSYFDSDSAAAANAAGDDALFNVTKLRRCGLGCVMCAWGVGYLGAKRCRIHHSNKDTMISRSFLLTPAKAIPSF